MSAVMPNQIKFNQANSCNTRPPSGLENQICIQNAVKKRDLQMSQKFSTWLHNRWQISGSKVFHAKYRESTLDKSALL